MKKIILILIFLPFTVFAQQEECAFVPHAEMYNINHFSRTVKSNFNTDEPYVLNVQFHLVNNDGDTNIEDNPFGLTEDNLLTSIAKINLEFNRFNIFFKYRSYTIIDETDYLSVYGDNTDPPTPTQLDLRAYSITQGNYDYNNINVFVTGTGNSAYFQVSDIFLNKTTVINALTDPNLPHEFAHALGLLHVFDGTLGSLSSEFFYNDVPDCLPGTTPKLAKPRFDPTSVYPNAFPTSSENVERNPNMPNFNADIAGDFVIDTNASFKGLNQNTCQEDGIFTFQEDLRVVDNSGNPDAECYFCTTSDARYCYVDGDNYYTTTINGTDTNIPLNSNNWQDIINTILVDCDQINSGEMYIDLDNERTNYMHYASGADHFSDGQGVRMREVIQEDIFGFLQNKLNLLDDGSVDLSVLYEPYKGSYFYAGPNMPEHRSLFQPGFDYKFVDCGHDPFNGIEIYNEPTPYNDDSFSFKLSNIIHQIDKYSLDFNNINHPNHSAIVIEQINGNQPRKCYNNFNRSANNGSVIKFNDGVPNTNVTVTLKNNSEINDSNLIQNLENGLYTIKKNYDDGTQEQQTILKNDN